MLTLSISACKLNLPLNGHLLLVLAVEDASPIHANVSAVICQWICWTVIFWNMVEY